MVDNKNKDAAQESGGLTTLSNIKGETAPKGDVILDVAAAREQFGQPETEEKKETKAKAKKEEKSSHDELKAENDRLEKQAEKLRTEKEEREKNDRLKAEIAELTAGGDKRTIFIKSNGANVTVERGRRVVKGSVNGEDFTVPVDQSVEVDAYIAEALQGLIDQQNSNKTTAAI